MSLLPSSVFRIASPTQNTSWETHEKTAANPQAAWTIPVLLGANSDYFKHYRYANERSPSLSEGAEIADSLGLGAENAGTSTKSFSPISPI